MEETTKKKRKSLGQHWYYITSDVCVLCGREKTYRERRLGPKPVNPALWSSYEESACGEHFI